MKLIDKLFDVGKVKDIYGVKFKRLPVFKKYKYVLLRAYSIQTKIIPTKEIILPYINLKINGNLLIKNGYAWDGASGITIDTDSSIRGSLIHDSFYQLMREKYLRKKNRLAADEILRDTCIEDGMYKWRANIWFFCVRKFAGKYAGK